MDGGEARVRGFGGMERGDDFRFCDGMEDAASPGVFFVASAGQFGIIQQRCKEGMTAMVAVVGRSIRLSDQSASRIGVSLRGCDAAWICRRRRGIE